MCGSVGSARARACHMARYDMRQMYVLYRHGTSRRSKRRPSSAKRSKSASTSAYSGRRRTTIERRAAQPLPSSPRAALPFSARTLWANLPWGIRPSRFVVISAVHGGCATSAKEKETLLLAARRTRRARPRPHVATQAPRCGSRAPPRAPLQRCGAQLRREGEVLDVGVQEKAHRRPEVGRGDAPVLPAQPHRRRLLWCKSACSAPRTFALCSVACGGAPRPSAPAAAAALSARRCFRRSQCALVPARLASP